VQSWASTFGLTFPILADPGWGVGDRYTSDGSYPNYTLIAPGGEVIRAGVSSISDSVIETYLP
jgi:hypothetical protein